MRKIALLLFLCFVHASFAQPDSLQPVNYKARKIILASGAGGLAVGSLVALNQAWYQQYNTGKFHFFNDDAEWLQMDKAGHAYSSYQVGRLMMDAFDWAGYNKKQKLFIGGTSGLAYLTVIECMDGFSDGWGFSWGDEVADILGSAMAVSQEAFWNEQRIQLKFSYAPGDLAKYNPSLLGDSPATRILKDYNAQTYWLSVNPGAFMRKESRFPKWLNVAFGYSAYGMLGGHANTIVVKDKDGNVLNFNRERRYLLSLDVDLTKIKTRSKFLKGLFSVINIIKIPAPALQFNGKKFQFYYLRQ